jgi:hypothetical protein
LFEHRGDAMPALLASHDQFLDVAQKSGLVLPQAKVLENRLDFAENLK